MSSVTQLGETMRTLMQTRAQEIGQEHDAFKRERKLDGASFAQGVVFGWLQNGEASLSELQATFNLANVEISRQGIDQRFTMEMADFLQELVRESVSQVVRAQPVETPVLQRFDHVYVMDGTRIELPDALRDQWRGSGGYNKPNGAAIKLGVRWDVRNGQITDLELQDGVEHDSQASFQEARLPANSLRIGDLAYHSFEVFEQIGADGSYWLTRHKTRTHVYLSPEADAPPLDLESWLPTRVGDRIDQQVYLGHAKRLPCRLIAQRVPQDVVQQRREALEETARRRQKPIREQAYALARWTIYLTNAPQHKIACAEAFVLGRYRWQIELLFKLWKDELDLDKSRSKKPARILCELYAKLIGILINHWCLLLTCWHLDRRSLWRAAKITRQFGWILCAALPFPFILSWVLTVMRKAVRGAKMEKSRQAPRTFQLWDKLVESAA